MKMKIFPVVVTTLALILLELLAGNWLLPMFFPLYGAVYFAAACSKRAGTISAFAAGVLLDLLYARPVMLLWLILPAVVVPALKAVKRFQRQMPLAALAAGAVCGALNGVVIYLLCKINGSIFPGPDPFSVVIFQSFTGAFFMLIFTSLADWLAFKCNLPRFSMNDNRRRRRGEL